MYMVECEEMVGGPYVTDVQGRRSDGGHMVVQKRSVNAYGSAAREVCLPCYK